MSKVHNMLVRTANLMGVESTKSVPQSCVASIVSRALCRKNTVALSSTELVKAMGSKVITTGVNGVKNNPKKMIALALLPAALFGIKNSIDYKNILEFFEKSVPTNVSEVLAKSVPTNVSEVLAKPVQIPVIAAVSNPVQNAVEVIPNAYLRLQAYLLDLL